MTAEPTGWVHHYVSTACLHEINDGDPDQHARCRATCKTCDRPCECANHTEDEISSAPPSWVDQARDIARELYGQLLRFGNVHEELEDRVATDPHLFWLRGEEQPPGTWTPPPGMPPHGPQPPRDASAVPHPHPTEGEPS